MNKQKEFLRQLDELFNSEPEHIDEAIMLAILFNLQKAHENQLLLNKCYTKHFNQITNSMNPLNDEL